MDSECLTHGQQILAANHCWLTLVVVFSKEVFLVFPPSPTPALWRGRNSYHTLQSVHMVPCACLNDSNHHTILGWFVCLSSHTDVINILVQKCVLFISAPLGTNSVYWTKLNRQETQAQRGDKTCHPFIGKYTAMTERITEQAWVSFSVILQYCLGAELGGLQVTVTSPHTALSSSDCHWVLVRRLRPLTKTILSAPMQKSLLLACSSPALPKGWSHSDFHWQIT